MGLKTSNVSDRYGSPADIKISSVTCCRVLVRLVVLIGVSFPVSSIIPKKFCIQYWWVSQKQTLPKFFVNYY